MENLMNRGAMDIGYAKERDNRISTRYRLWRRTVEIISALEEFAPEPIKDIIDLGTADGRMLHKVKKKFPKSRCVGVELNPDLADFGKSLFPEIEIVQGDIQKPDFADDSFDAVLLTAVIEHLPYPEQAVYEAKRILRKGGILVLTSPDPFWEYLATRLGHLKGDHHHQVMNMKQLSGIMRRNGFTISLAKKFMLSPVGMPYEFLVEKWIQQFNLDFILANQLVVGKL